MIDKILIRIGCIDITTMHDNRRMYWHPHIGIRVRGERISDDQT